MNIFMFNLKNTIASVLMIGYILSPVDLIPEAVFGPLGLIDDAIVGLAWLSYMRKQAKEVKQ